MDLFLLTHKNFFNVGLKIPSNFISQLQGSVILSVFQGNDGLAGYPQGVCQILLGNAPALSEFFYFIFQIDTSEMLSLFYISIVSCFSKNVKYILHYKLKNLTPKTEGYFHTKDPRLLRQRPPCVKGAGKNL